MTRRNPDSPERLLRAARTEFSRQGRAGARTDRIASLASVNKQLIHYYFQTKHGLYGAVLQAAAREMAEALGRTPLIGLTAVERLRRLVRSQFEYLAEQRELTRLLVRDEGGAGEWFDAAIRPLTDLLTEGQATGFFRDDVDPLYHARQALLLNLGYFMLRPPAESWGDAGLWRDRTAELVVRGCTW